MQLFDDLGKRSAPVYLIDYFADFDETKRVRDVVVEVGEDVRLARQHLLRARPETKLRILMEKYVIFDNVC